MALIPNPQFNPNDPNSQRYIFSDPETAVINPTTGQTASGGVITAEKLTPVQPTNFQTAPPVSVPSVPDFTALGPVEQQVQTESEEIRRRQTELLGKGAFERAEETRLGLPEFQRQQRDLTSQLLTFKTELEDLQNQAATIPSQVEEQFTGRGATAGGIAPIMAGELRRNQIKQATVASKALTVSARLQAIQGNIETANDMVKLAVEAKFGPIEEELAVKRANYDVIIKSPAFSAEQKERAKTLDEAAKKKEAEIKVQRDNVEDARKMAIKAIENYPDDSNVAILSRQVMGFKDDDPNILKTATELLGKYQAKPEKAPANVIGSAETGYLQFNPATGRYDIPVSAPREKPGGGISADQATSRLLAQGLPTNILTTGNVLTKGNKDNITSAGVPPSVVDLITRAILEGNTLEKIRQVMMEGYGKDVGFGYLDKYMSTLQGGASDIPSHPF
ncbi:MAG: hypothetical protein UT82_C0018G0017 [Parcubacteria group bacterium GW2011_GWB1_40_14]|nr:MAG: hypothetical protein UT82_C0018G0017 [Parcubacteria group bacterium GW2011_GWB1_40_14]